MKLVLTETATYQIEGNELKLTNNYLLVLML